MSVSSGIVTSLIGGALSTVANAVSGLVDVIPKGNIGGISIACTFSERLVDTLQVTEHPVEQGAEISDHTYVKMPEVSMRVGWSNSQSDGALADLTALLSVFDSQTPQAIAGGQISVADYVGGVYANLLALQQQQTLFTLQTSIRQYTSMVMTLLDLKRDPRSMQALFCDVVFRQLRVVSTSATSLPSISNQSTPADTAEIAQLGPVTAQSATPSLGGTVPPSDWFAPP